MDENIDVGHGNLIGSKWLPDGEPTGLYDINGVELKTRDKVTLTGCTSPTAYVGYNRDNSLMLIFGTKTTSVGWFLNREVIQKRKITKIEG